MGTLTVGPGASASVGAFVNDATLFLAGPDGTSPASNLHAASYVQAATANFVVGIGGTTPAQGYPVLDVNGDAILGGSLTVLLTSGFAPTPGDTFTILTVNTFFRSVQNTFASTTLPPGFDVHYAPRAVTLTYIPEPASLLAAAPWPLVVFRRARRARARPPLRCPTADFQIT